MWYRENMRMYEQREDGDVFEQIEDGIEWWCGQ